MSNEEVKRYVANAAAQNRHHSHPPNPDAHSAFLPTAAARKGRRHESMSRQSLSPMTGRMVKKTIRQGRSE